MDNEEVLRRIERKLKVGKLDSLLLFLSSSLAIVFGIVQATIGGYNSIIFFIPLLFTGWLMPVYVGYLRGAILLDSVVERIRGWVYLTSGIGAYITYHIAVRLLALHLEGFYINSIVVGLLTSLFAFFPRVFLERAICRISDVEVTYEITRTSFFTFAAAFMSSLTVTFLSVSFTAPRLGELTYEIVFIITLISGFLISSYF